MKKSVEYLDKKLQEYGASDVYPFHMPGHKRQDMGMVHPEKMDITEVSGFDNLHHAEGIIAQAQERMANVFGADRSFFLVNGSTSGLLSAICGTVSRRGKILIARNCHKAVYNAIYLRELSVEYLYPMQTEWGIQGSIDPRDIQEKLDADPDIQAVLITSPTYDGVVSDIETISKIVHAHKIPLIVDEAHGAHFGFSAGFPKKALALGADVVIESIHKTLPAYTQSAALHLKGTLVKQEQIQRFSGIYQSSSPSYLLMAGLDRCVRVMEEQGQDLMEGFEKRLKDFYEKTKNLKYLRVFPMWKSSDENFKASDENFESSDGELKAFGMNENAAKDSGENIYCKDNSKVLIFCQNANMSGQHLAEILLTTYGLEMEMNSGHYVTALTSLMDTESGFARLAAALQEIDASMISETKDRGMKENISSDVLYQNGASRGTDWSHLIDTLYQPKEKQMEIAWAEECPSETIAFADAMGRVSAEFAYLYPPGIPFLTPGEVIPEKLAEIVDILLKEGFEIQGLEDMAGKRIKVATSE